MAKNVEKNLSHVKGKQTPSLRECVSSRFPYGKLMKIPFRAEYREETFCHRKPFSGLFRVKRVYLLEQVPWSFMMSVDDRSNLAISEDGPSEPAVRWSDQDPAGGGSRRDVALRALKASSGRRGEANGVGPDGMDLRGIDLVGEDLSGLDLSRCDLSGANLSGADLRGSNLSWARLSEANLTKAQLDGCELLGADLSSANLNECSAERAGLGVADLTGASLISAQLKEVTLSKSRLCHTDFRAANLQGSRISEADLTGADFTRADLRATDLKQSNVSGTKFELADMRESRLMGVANFTKANWVGADIRGVDLRGAYMVRRAIWDENYLHEFRTRSRYHEILYQLWWITSDCGRSLTRWTLFILSVTLIFAFAYSKVGIDYGDYETAISPLYYSVVTLTTLGYGDVVPTSPAAQILAALHALLGYVGLGGLLSILANKMARRAD